MRTLLDAILRRLILEGFLTVRLPDGSFATYEGARPGPEFAVRITDDRTVRRLVTNPGLAFGEAYVDGTLLPVGCQIAELLDFFYGNLAAGARHPVLELRKRLARAVKPIALFNPASRARRNVAHHYDLNGRLYGLFLDRDRHYSCAYFEHLDATLEQAQAAKLRHIARKLLLDRPGLEILDIGCGWGGLAIALARDHGARVTGITLSAEQLAFARARAEAAGLADRVTFELCDYRAVRGVFDRVVSVGMFEHVGTVHYPSFFHGVRQRLEPDGVALIHAIGRSDGPGSTNPWIGKYIFPGGYSPALSEVFRAAERSGLIATDCEILRLHYAETLRHWRRRFAASRDAIASLYDERFCRMFELYLAGSEYTFRHLGHMVWQLQLSREVGRVPITRDYLGEVPIARPQASLACDLDPCHASSQGV